MWLYWCIYICGLNYNSYFSRSRGWSKRQADERNKRIISKNCAPFTDRTSETNNTQIDNSKQRCCDANV